DLITTLHDELSWFRANYHRDVALLHEIRSSISFRFVSNIIWPLSNRIPVNVRRRARSGLRKLREQIEGLGGSSGAARRATEAMNREAILVNDAASAVDFIPVKIAPLRLRVSGQTPRRINIVMATVDLNYFFAG